MHDKDIESMLLLKVGNPLYTDWMGGGVKDFQNTPLWNLKEKLSHALINPLVC